MSDVDRARLDEFVEAHDRASLLQSSGWPDMKENWGREYLGVEEDGKLVATAVVLTRSIPMARSMWYMPRGPVMDYSDEKLLAFFLKSIKQYAKSKRCGFLKIDPNVILRKTLMENEEGIEELHEAGEKSALALEVFDLFKKAGFRHGGFLKEMHSTIQPRYAAITEKEDFENDLPKRTKRFLKDAKKSQVVVTKGDVSDLDDFAFVVSKTEERKGVHLRSQDYFRRFFEVYGDRVQLYIARIPLKEACEEFGEKADALKKELAETPESAPKKQRIVGEQLASAEKQLAFFRECRERDGDVAVLAGCLSVLYANTTEMLYAGMNGTYSKVTAQFPVYFDTMSEAFSKGAAYASMGGVPGTLDDGLTKFKANFIPHVVEYLGEFDYVFSNYTYFMYEKMVPFGLSVLRKLRR